MVMPVDKYMRLRQEPRRFGEDEEPDVPNQAPNRYQRHDFQLLPYTRRRPKGASSSPPRKDDDR